MKVPPRCELELQEVTTWPHLNSRAVRQKFRCRACKMSGTLVVRPAEQLEELLEALRVQHALRARTLRDVARDAP